MSLGSRNGQTTEPAAGTAPTRPPRGRFYRAVRGACVVAAVLITAGVLAFIGGFLWFADIVPTEEIALRDDADGIVVLTGGSSRIADAIELLGAGRGKRLLITGVHRATSTREIMRLAPRYEKLVACCVDLDHSAVNTVGNAAETRRWVKSRGFRSLIVVTSSYHMPRSMAELERQLPEVKLIAFPVVTDKLRTEPWWASLPTAKLLLSEYLKYMFARVRMRVDSVSDMIDVAGARGRIGS
jgi:uncharacterized SAM-binding protein YcdF (DUF218 family)